MMTTGDYASRAAQCGMTEARQARKHAAAWHNIQVPQFARLAEMVWGDQVCVLPSATVYMVAGDESRNANRGRKTGLVKIEISVADDDLSGTTYQVGSRRLRVDATDGTTIEV